MVRDPKRPQEAVAVLKGEMTVVPLLKVRKSLQYGCQESRVIPLFHIELL